jgi:tRNA(Leu) C34 or U34 (ribose-2'-O)-methylase TrmL
MEMSVSVVLHDPKYPHNLGQAVRACSCFGVADLLVTGNRIKLEKEAGKGFRLPREERMREYRSVSVMHASDKPTLDQPGLTPVAVELVPGAELLPWFEHPEDAMYVFGPEDGGLPTGILAACHRFVQIPMLHCANLSSAVYMILLDRHMKRVQAGLEAPLVLKSSEPDMAEIDR